MLPPPLTDSASSRSIFEEDGHGESSSSFSQKASTTKAFPHKHQSLFFSPPVSHGQGGHLLVTLGRLAGLTKHGFHKIRDVWNRMHHTIFPPDLSLVQPCHHAALYRTGKRSWKAVLPQHNCAPQCPGMPVPHANANVPPALCCAPAQAGRALPSVSHGTKALSVCHSSSKLTAGRAASPLLAAVSFNMVIHLPKDGWLGWMI